MNVIAPTPVQLGCTCAASGRLGLTAASMAGRAGYGGTTPLAPPASRMDTDEEEDLMTRRQVAFLFRVTSAVVATWARRGRLPEVRNEEGKPRYRRGDVEALFRSDLARRMR